METIAWRYKPEFLINTLINDEVSGDAIEIMPSPATYAYMQNYGFITRTAPGKLLGFARQVLQGDNWLPAFDIARPFSFSFWLRAKQDGGFKLLDIFDDSAQAFGNQVFYANNLSATGEIDANISGNIVELMPNAASVEGKRASISAYTFATSFSPGEYSQIKAGKIKAGAAVNLNLSESINANQTSVELDFRLMPKGAYMVELDGASDLREKVVFDETAMGAGIKGFVDIYKDTWVSPSQPREYRINFKNA